MENNIVRETSAEMKTIAKNTLSGIWMQVFMGILVYYLLAVTIPEIVNAIIPFGVPTFTFEGNDFQVKGMNIGSLYKFILGGAFDVGLCSFLLAMFRKKDIQPGYIFNGFEIFPKSFALMFMMSFFIVLWSLLFIIPGFIAAIRYSQSFYILADNPEKGVMQCINESKMMMNGNKGRYFYTCISFIGWVILSGILAYIPAQVPAGIFRIVVSLITDIPYMFVLVYMRTTVTVFYDLVSGNLKAQTE